MSKPATSSAPAKFLRPGKVVVLLNGRHAGKKAFIVNAFDCQRKFFYLVLAFCSYWPSSKASVPFLFYASIVCCATLSLFPFSIYFFRIILTCLTLFSYKVQGLWSCFGCWNCQGSVKGYQVNGQEAHPSSLSCETFY